MWSVFVESKFIKGKYFSLCCFETKIEAEQYLEKILARGIYTKGYVV